jgi:hypothetical protein
VLDTIILEATLSRLLNTQKFNVHTTVTVILYGWEIWPLILRLENRLWVSEYRVLTRIFGPKTEEGTGGCNKVRKDNFHYLYYTTHYYNYQFRIIRNWGTSVVRNSVKTTLKI